MCFLRWTCWTNRQRGKLKSILACVTITRLPPSVTLFLPSPPHTLLLRYLDPDTATLLSELGQGVSKKFHKLNKAITTLVSGYTTFLLLELEARAHAHTQIDDYSLVQFHPLDISEEDTIGDLLTYIDTTIQYGEDLDIKVPRVCGVYYSVYQLVYLSILCTTLTLCLGVCRPSLHSIPFRIYVTLAVDYVMPPLSLSLSLPPPFHTHTHTHTPPPPARGGP